MKLFERRLFVLVVFAALGAIPCWAEDKEMPSEGAADASAKEPVSKPWFVMVGTGNLHAHRDETEHEINTLLNLPASLLIPDWKQPTTFRDWSGQYKLWDGHVGGGKVLTPHFTWSADMGGGIATIKNHGHFHLLGIVPFRRTVNFSTQVGFIASGFSYYPWRLPSLVNAPKNRNRFLRSISAARPYVQADFGYLALGSWGHVQFNFPVVGELLKVDVPQYSHVTYESPTIGVEIPLTEKNSATVSAGYLFFNEHPREFNTLAVYFFLKHMF